MSDDQVSTILKAISDARQESTTSIGALATSVAEFKGNIDARVEATEDYITSEKKWSRYKTLAVPAYAFLHAVASHFKIPV